MNFDALHNRLERLPMVRALAPLALGIALANHYSLPSPLVWVGFLACGVVALMQRSWLYAASALVLFGWVLHELHPTTHDAIPHGVRTEFSIEVGDQSEGTIIAWRDPHTHRWCASQSRVLLRGDSTLKLESGEGVVARGYLNSLGNDSYGRLMQRRGFGGVIWLGKSGLLEHTPAQKTSLHARASERLKALGLTTTEYALCAAMTIGERTGITPEQRKIYARSGTSHLLAVSGLHVGIVFLLINALLWWLPLLHRGHILRNILAITLIWIYAATTGLSPSVVRATIMFSALQLSFTSSSVYIGGNILAATAIVMLIFRPSNLLDISFQLSFIAVAAIMAWGVPLCRSLRTRHRLLNLVYDSLSIALVASVATAPLVAHTFGVVSVVGVVLNPMVIPLAMMVVLSCLVWVIVPTTLLAPVLRATASTAARWQNHLADQGAALPWSALEWQPGSALTVTIYALMVVITLAAWSMVAKKPLPLLRDYSRNL